MPDLFYGVAFNEIVPESLAYFAVATAYLVIAIVHLSLDPNLQAFAIAGLDPNLPVEMFEYIREVMGRSSEETRAVLSNINLDVFATNRGHITLLFNYFSSLGNFSDLLKENINSFDLEILNMFQHYISVLLQFNQKLLTFLNDVNYNNDYGNVCVELSKSTEKLMELSTMIDSVITDE